MAEINKTPKGTLTFENEVIAKIAGLAAIRVSGLEGMSGGLADNLADLIGRQNFAKGVKVEMSDGEVTVNLQVVAEYGVEMPGLFKSIQDNVKSDLEKMTGLKVAAINVHVQEITSKKENVKEKKTGEEQKSK